MVPQVKIPPQQHPGSQPQPLRQQALSPASAAAPAPAAMAAPAAPAAPVLPAAAVPTAAPSVSNPYVSALAEALAAVADCRSGAALNQSLLLLRLAFLALVCRVLPASWLSTLSASPQPGPAPLPEPRLADFYAGLAPLQRIRHAFSHPGDLARRLPRLRSAASPVIPSLAHSVPSPEFFSQAADAFATLLAPALRIASPALIPAPQSAGFSTLAPFSPDPAGLSLSRLSPTPSTLSTPSIPSTSSILSILSIPSIQNSQFSIQYSPPPT